MAQDKEFDPQVIATTLMGSVQSTFETMCGVSFTKDPEYVEKEIIEYDSKMRVFGLEKFNGPCYLSYINFYLNKKSFQEKDPCGVIIIYVEEKTSERMFEAFGFPGVDEEDEESLLDSVGEFANIIAGQFKNDIRAIGYTDLVISAPLKFKNDIPGGAEFCYSEKKLYEISFDIWKTKALVVDISMAPVPHAD